MQVVTASYLGEQVNADWVRAEALTVLESRSEAPVKTECAGACLAISRSQLYIKMSAKECLERAGGSR